eukprot:gene6522-7552_t
MSRLNPLNALPSAIRDINFNPLNLNLNPLNVDFQGHRDRVFNFFQNGTDDLNHRMQSVVSNIRSNDYKKKMHKVLTKIKDTKEYKATSMADYDVIFESVDMYSNFQSDPTLNRDEIEQVRDFRSYKARAHYWLKKERISTILFIPILGILIALMGIVCDISLTYLGDLQKKLVCDMTKKDECPMYDLIMGVKYVAFSVTLSFISVSCISFISPYAVGSGIPEMKSILSGINLSRVLGFKTLVSKLVGMVAATAAGLTIGRTGPFMHASAIIAHQMMNLSYFSNIKKNQIVRYQMFVCALASGVVANFYAPIGGLLFSIEVTATNCIFGSLWKGFLCATTTAIVYYMSRGLVTKGGFSGGTVYQFSYELTRYGMVEVGFFVLIGIVTGLIGALFVFLYEKIVRFRLRHTFLKQSRIGLVVVIATISATLTYLAGPLAREPFSYCMKQFIGNHTYVQPALFAVPTNETVDPSTPAPMESVVVPNEIYNLLVYIGVKLFLTAFNITIPIPGGAITPFIVTGAAIGRVFGEIIIKVFGFQALPARAYAVIASAGLVSGTIRALSPSIFVLELTGQLSLLIPVLICSITSSAVGNFFNKPLFDTALKIQGLPFLSNYRSEKVYQMTAKQIMRSDINYLSMHSTVKDILAFLDKFRYTFVPIVDSHEVTISEDGERQYQAQGIWSGHFLGDIIESGETALLMDLAPSQIPDLTPMNKVFHLFTMLGLSFTYVTSMGKLVGVITKTDLIAKEL